MYEQTVVSLDAATQRLRERRDDTAGLELGTPVRFRHPLRRTHVPGDYRAKVWAANPFRRGEYVGIVVGLRTLSDGENLGYEEITYRPLRHYAAVLVAESLRTRPVFVLPADVEVIR
jgi:hypothetical protein